MLSFQIAATESALAEPLIMSTEARLKEESWPVWVSDGLDAYGEALKSRHCFVHHYPRTGKQPDRASSNRIREKGVSVTVIPCLVVAHHGVFSIEEVSTYPLERAVIPGTMKCVVGYAQSHLCGFLMIRKELMCITRSRAT